MAESIDGRGTPNLEEKLRNEGKPVELGLSPNFGQSIEIVLNAFKFLAEQLQRRINRCLAGSGAGIAILLARTDYFVSSPFHPYLFLSCLFVFCVALALAFYVENQLGDILSHAEVWAGMVMTLDHADRPDQAEMDELGERLVGVDKIIKSATFVLVTGAVAALAGVFVIEIFSTYLTEQPM